jgi:hypothetical protein
MNLSFASLRDNWPGILLVVVCAILAGVLLAVVRNSA